MYIVFDVMNRYNDVNKFVNICTFVQHIIINWGAHITTLFNIFIVNVYCKYGKKFVCK